MNSSNTFSSTTETVANAERNSPELSSPKAVPKKKFQTYLYSAVIVVNIISFAVGISLTWSSPVLPQLNGDVKTDDMPTTRFLTKEEESWMGSLLTLGATCGPFIAGILSDLIGRKHTLIVCGGLLYLISFLILAFAEKIILFHVARFMGGFAMGSVFCVLPNYVSEISQTHNRGALGSIMNVFLTLGLFFSYVTGPFMSIMVFSLICAIFPALFILLFLLYPETPYHLIQKRQYVSAEMSLKKLRSSETDNLGVEFQEIIKTVEEKLLAKINILDLFKSKKLIKALSFSLALGLFQQLSGINVVLFYTQTIFESTESGISPSVASIIIGGAQLIPSAITYFVVDRAGRRITLLCSAFGMIISQAPLGVYFYLKDNDYDVDSIKWLPITALVVYIVSFRFGFGPLPWTIMAELFPPNVKSVASLLTTSFCFLLGFFVTRYFQPITEHIGMAGGFWIFTGFCFLAILFVYFCLPETKKKSFQEINAILYGKKVQIPKVV